MLRLFFCQERWIRTEKDYMDTAGLFPQSIHIPHTKKSDFTEAAFSPLSP